MSRQFKIVTLIILLTAGLAFIACAAVSTYYQNQAETIVEQSKTNYLEIPDS